jgi:hypothetical protein
MKANIIAAVIIAVGIVMAGFVIGGRYQITRVDEYTTHRIDRWTGALAVCAQWQRGAVACANAPELYHDGKAPLAANSN